MTFRPIIWLVWAAAVIPGCCHHTGDDGAAIAVRANVPIVVDGHLDESAWQHATPYFLKYHDGSIDVKIREIKTCVRLLWDEQNLYVAFSCRDDDVFAYLEKRDATVFWEDCCEIVIAPEKKTEYYEFTVNANGALYDACNFFDHYNVLHSESKFNAAVDIATSVDGTINNNSDKDHGWIVEMAIPWQKINAKKIFPGRKLHGNFLRFDYARTNGEITVRPRLISDRTAAGYAFMSLWPTYIKQWPHSPETFGTILLQK